MAPHPGIDPEQIRDKARKDILDLLESVCESVSPFNPYLDLFALGKRKEEPGY